MATTTIPWGDGSGDNIYLTYSSASGNQTVRVSSDANTGYLDRTKVITFTTTTGNATATLTVTQSSNNIIIITRNDVAISHSETALGYKPVLPYDSQIEYLESTGTQYIDTGYVPNADTIAVLDAALTSAGNETTMFGLINSNGGVRFHFGTYQSKWHYGVSPTAANGKWFNFTTPELDTTRHTFELRGNGYSAVDLETNTVSVTSGTYSMSIYLFGRHIGTTTNGRCKMRLYGFTISEASSLIHDFIPVRIDQVGYLYDRVSGELFGNNGTGSFVLGQDV